MTPELHHLLSQQRHDELMQAAERFRAGVVETTDGRTGAARDFDVRGEKWIATKWLRERRFE